MGRIDNEVADAFWHLENRFFYVEKHGENGSIDKSLGDPGRAIYFIPIDDICCEDAHLMVDNLPAEELDMDGVGAVLCMFEEIMLVDLRTFGTTVMTKKVKQ